MKPNNLKNVSLNSGVNYIIGHIHYFIIYACYWFNCEYNCLELVPRSWLSKLLLRYWLFNNRDRSTELNCFFLYLHFVFILLFRVESVSRINMEETRVLYTIYACCIVLSDKGVIKSNMYKTRSNVYLYRG